MKVAQITIEETLGMTKNVKIPDNMTEDEIRNYINKKYLSPSIEIDGLSNEVYDTYINVNIREINDSNKFIFQPEEDWETFKTRL